MLPRSLVALREAPGDSSSTFTANNKVTILPAVTIGHPVAIKSTVNIFPATDRTNKNYLFDFFCTI